MLAILQFLVIFIVISILFVLLRVIFAIIKGMIIIRRSMKNNKDYADSTTSKNYSNYKDGKTIELTKDQYKVE